jgi:hypothetical protein
MKLIINEKQEQFLIGMLLNEEKTYPVEPDKVLVVKKYLDKNFIRGNYSNVNANGDIENSPVAGMKNPKTGKVEVNLYKGQVFDKIEAEFKNIYEDKVKRTKFLKTVLDYWFRDKISSNGLLNGTNKY